MIEAAVHRYLRDTALRRFRIQQRAPRSVEPSLPQPYSRCMARRLQKGSTQYVLGNIKSGRQVCNAEVGVLHLVGMSQCRLEERMRICAPQQGGRFSLGQVATDLQHAIDDISGEYQIDLSGRTAHAFGRAGEY